MTKLEMMQHSQGLSNLYTGLETDLIANIAEYLKRGDIASTTAQWKMQMLAQLGALDKANLKTIAEYAELTPEMLTETLENAALTAIGELEPGFQELARDGIINGTEVPIESTMERALEAYYKQAKDDMNMVNTTMLYKSKSAAQRLINDTAELADKQSFLNMLGKATGKTVTGAESRQAAMRQCIKEMSDKGIPAFVDRLGREWSPEAYINMSIRTTVANTAHQAQLDRMDDYDLNLVEVSSHAGARPKCAKDQGKIFNRSGKGGVTEDLNGNKIRYYAWSESSYGEPDGLLGINCGHQIYPFVPSISRQTYFPYDEEENDELYQKMQRQRELERRVRKSKRECMMLDKLGDAKGLEKASVTLKQRQDALKQYCSDNGLSYKSDRTAVVGYNKAVAGNVRKSLTSAKNNGKMKSNKKLSAAVQTPPDFNKYPIRDDLDSVKAIKNTISETLRIPSEDIKLDGIRNADALEPFVKQLHKIQNDTGMVFPGIQAMDIIVDDELCIAAYNPYANKLYISSRYFNSKEALEDTMKQWANSGFLPKQAKNVRYLAEHEAAHIRIPDEKLESAEAIKIHKQFIKSKYMNDNDINIAEFFADSIAVYRTSPTSTPTKMLEAVEYLKKEGIL